MDILTAGFPCQPVSIAGKRLGFADDRSNVFFKLIEIIKKHKPRFVIFENVKNLKTHDNGKTFKIITDNITSAGYKFKDKLFDTAKDTPIPQHRERIYVICFRDDADFVKFTFPIADISPKIEIKNLIEAPDNIPTKYYYTDKLAVWAIVNRDVIKTIDTNTIYQYRRTLVRENMSGNSPTLTANMGFLQVINAPLLKDARGIRKLTPLECFKLQGFPASYRIPENISDSGLYHLAGNGITVRIMEKIAEKIVELF